MDDFEERCQDLVAGLEKDGIFDEMDRKHQADLESCPEWSRREATHLHEIMTAWVVGVLQSYEYYRNQNGYELPANFGRVFSHISRRLCEKFPENKGYMGAVYEISLCEIRQWLKQWAMELSEFQRWNELPGSGITHRNSPLATKPTFIDLDVPSHRAAIYVRDQRRNAEAFERYFKRVHPKEEE